MLTRNRMMAWFAAAVVIAGLMSSGLWFKHSLQHGPDRLVVRQVELAAPPPPPPPPPVNQSNTATSAVSVDLDIAGAGVAMEFEKVQLESVLDMEVAKVEPDLDFSDRFSDSLNVNWQAFGLSELDEMPKLLTNFKVNYPKSLSRRGVNQVEIVLDVMIDEGGAVLLRRVVQNEYPELEQEIKKLVQKARFTAPKKNGVAVRAAFNWPLELANT